MEAKLVVVGGDAQSGEYRLTLPTVVGRSRQADLKLPHALVSRQHCELYEADGVLMVRDMGSLNGTFVGESKITIETPLEPGDLLTIGSVTFRAVYGGASDLPASEPAAEQAKTVTKPAAKAAAVADKKPAGAKKSAVEKSAAAKEIGETKQAGGLADLEQLRAAANSEVDDSHAGIVDPQPEEESADFDFNWLEDSQGESADLPSPDLETEEVPAVNDEEPDEESDVDDDESDSSDLLDLDDPDEKPKVEEKPAKPRGKSDAKAPIDEEQTLQFGQSEDAEDEDDATAKPARHKIEEDDDNLDDFFKSLE